LSFEPYSVESGIGVPVDQRFRDVCRIAVPAASACGIGRGREKKGLLEGYIKELEMFPFE